jgi:hypothetical protein
VEWTSIRAGREIVPIVGRSVAPRRTQQPRLKAVAISVVLSAVGAGIAALIVALTSIAAWIATLIAGAILAIGYAVHEWRRAAQS